MKLLSQGVDRERGEEERERPALRKMSAEEVMKVKRGRKRRGMKRRREEKGEKCLSYEERKRVPFFTPT